MAPAVIQINKNLPPPSPLWDGTQETWERKKKPRAPANERSSKFTPRSVRFATRSEDVDTKELRDLKSKYQHAKDRMDRIKKESSSNKKVILDLSSVVRALQDISVDYEKCDDSSDAVDNVKRKVRAIDDQLNDFSSVCDDLEREKEVQSATIEKQEGQIRGMGEHITTLRDRLLRTRKELDDERSMSLSQVSSKHSEDEQTILSQQEKIRALETKVRALNPSAVDTEIITMEQSNATKYAEIQELQTKLAALKATEKNELHQSIDSLRNSFSHASGYLQSSIKKNLSQIDFPKIDLPQIELPKKLELPEMPEMPVMPEMPKIDLKSIDIPKLECSLPECGGCSKMAMQMVSMDECRKGAPSDSDSVEMIVDQKGIVVSKDALADDDDESASSFDTSTALESPEDRSSKYTNSTASGSSSGSIDAEKYKVLQTELTEWQSKYEKLRTAYREVSNDPAQVELQDKYDHLMARLLTVEAENTKNQELHQVSSSTTKKLSQSFEKEKEKAELLGMKHEKLKNQYNRTVQSLEEERERVTRMVEDYQQLAENDQQGEAYAKLQKLHHMVVLKLADLGEENETCQEERDDTLAQCDMLNTKSMALEGQIEDLTFKLKEKQEAYYSVKVEQEDMAQRLEVLCDQYEGLKEKYVEAVQEKSASTAADAKSEELQQVYEANLILLKELEAESSKNEEAWKDEHSKALAKVEVLEETNRELELVQEKFNSSEAKWTLMEREFKELSLQAEKAVEDKAQREKHLEDMLFHYKQLKEDHEETKLELERVRALVFEEPADEIEPTSSDGSDDIYTSLSGDEAKLVSIKEKLLASAKRVHTLQNQRDAALSQVKDSDEDLKHAKRLAAQALEGKVAREGDLKTVLEHYKAIQEKYESAALRVVALEVAVAEAYERAAESLEQERATTDGDRVPEDSSTPKDVPEEDSSAETETEAETASVPTAVTEEDSLAQLMTEMSQLSKPKGHAKTTADSCISTPSSSEDTADESNTSVVPSLDLSGMDWKESKIVQTMKDLGEAQKVVDDLDVKHKDALVKLEVMERKLLIAQRQAQDATDRRLSREENLRDVVAQLKKLERDHEQVLGSVEELQQQLERARSDVKVRKEEAKVARERVSGVHKRYRKLQTEHGQALAKLEQQRKTLLGFQSDTAMADDTAAIRKFRIETTQEKVNLLKENEAMKVKVQALTEALQQHQDWHGASKQ